MSLGMKSLISSLNNSLALRKTVISGCRCYYAIPSPIPQLRNERKHQQSGDGEIVKGRIMNVHPDARLMYPEFMPDPEPKFRNILREKLERQDMLSRRSVVDLPEFYVGSVVAVTVSDPHAQGKTNRFVGICIKRVGCGLRAEFTLRNVIDHQGIEIRYMLYDPTIQQMQVLRLEKRLDDRLDYLCDADPKYSTFPQDMEPEILPVGSKVPLNELKIELKPRPWTQKWWIQDMKGLVGLEKHIRMREGWRMKVTLQPFLKYDIMKEYRESIPEEQQNEIWSEVYSQLDQLHTMRKKMSRKKSFIFPKKMA